MVVEVACCGPADTPRYGLIVLERALFPKRHRPFFCYYGRLGILDYRLSMSLFGMKCVFDIHSVLMV